MAAARRATGSSYAVRLLSFPLLGRFHVAGQSMPTPTREPPREKSVLPWMVCCGKGLQAATSSKARGARCEQGAKHQKVTDAQTLLPRTIPGANACARSLRALGALPEAHHGVFAGNKPNAVLQAAHLTPATHLMLGNVPNAGSVRNAGNVPNARQRWL